MKTSVSALPLIALALSCCAPSALPPAEGIHRSAVVSLKQAASKSLTAEQRAALYLDAAREAAALLDSTRLRKRGTHHL